MQEGPAEGFFPNGKPNELSFYKAGLLDGELKRFYQSGKLMQQGVYGQGKLVAPLRTFSEDGKVTDILQPQKEGG